MIECLLRARHRSFGALFYLHTLWLATFDMMVHEPSSHDAIQNMNITAQWNKLRKEITKLDGPEVLGMGYEWGFGQANFGHAMEEYGVGYYGYL
jgi:metallopeptidase MepB